MDAIAGPSAGTMRADIRDAAAAGTGDDTRTVRQAISGDGRSAVWPRITRLASILSASDGEDTNSAPVSGGRSDTSGTGSSNGGAVRLDGGPMRHRGFAFPEPVARNGYRWWYVDALSDDGAYGLTIIAFIGSVFSPYYKWRRRQGGADPADHCAMNVALYGRGARRWTMTERPGRALQRTQERLTIGPSSMNWDGNSLVIDLREIAVPWPSPVRGQVRVTPQATFDQAYALDSQGLHRWQPIAPRSRVVVEMERPALQWEGDAYVDTNWGDEPLENAFVDWHWSRANSGEASCVFYDARLRTGGARQIALRFEQDKVEPIASPPCVDMQRTGWRVCRATRSNGRVQVLQTLEDTPFYARSVISAEHDGKLLTGVHESLSLDRFSMPIVQAMLPFRMPRAPR